MEEVQNCDFSCNNTQYYCSICNTTPSQISHHKAHLKTQKHIYKKKCFEQCVNMTIFHISNTKDMSKECVVKMFEDDTGYKYIKGNRESTEKFRNWRLNRKELLLSEYPKSIIPEVEHDCSDNLLIDDWFKQIIEKNETMVIKPKKKDTNIEKNNDFKEIINNQSVEEVITKAIEFQCEFDVAVVFYKLLSEKYSFKSFKGNVWIDKSNISLSSNDVSSNVRKEITTTLKNAFENYGKNLDVETLQYKSCLKLIEKFNKTSFKNNLIREAREIFFDN
jgi:hypothetical protein